MTWNVYRYGNEMKFVNEGDNPNDDWEYLFDIEHDPWSSLGIAEIADKLHKIEIDDNQWTLPNIGDKIIANGKVGIVEKVHGTLVMVPDDKCCVIPIKQYMDYTPVDGITIIFFNHPTVTGIRKIDFVWSDYIRAYFKNGDVKEYPTKEILEVVI